MLGSLIEGALAPFKLGKNFLIMLAISLVITLLSIDALINLILIFVNVLMFAPIMPQPIEKLAILVADISKVELSLLVVEIYAIIMLAIFGFISVSKSKFKEKIKTSDLLQSAVLAMLMLTFFVFFVVITTVSLTLLPEIIAPAAFLLAVLLMFVIFVKAFMYAPAAIAAGKHTKQAIKESIKVTQKHFWSSIALMFIITLVGFFFGNIAQFIEVGELWQFIALRTIITAYALSFAALTIASYFEKLK